MSRKKGPLPLIESLFIEDYAAEGKALGHHEGIVIFVGGAVPGDIVTVQITKQHRRFMEGRIVAFIKKSECRVEPKCPHFGVCGGCKWQNLPYQKQLEYKTKQVEDQLIRIGKLSVPEITPCIGSQDTYWYRNKLEYSFSSKRWLTYEQIQQQEEIVPQPALGFHVPNVFDKALDISICYLQREPSNAIRDFIRNYTIDNGFSFYDTRSHEGLMRGIIIRTSSTGEVMLSVVFGYEHTQHISMLMNALKEKFPEITSLYYFINEKWNDSLADQTPVLFYGKEYMEEKMEDLSFKISPKSFYQTNSKQALRLYTEARTMAELRPTDTLYDLYTGTGSIANFCARFCNKVIGIEYVEDAIKDAKLNSQANSITNTEFFAGDMKKVLNKEFIQQHGKADVMIVDPPRAGMDRDVVDVIMEASPERIVYVSCNPATQARDLALMASKYDIIKVQPVDMFPHTQHVENIVKLQLKNTNI
ncbi:MAG: 23S rRNA (uracil(1939)-C(5))-methyltransferase RlmD [Alistipes sp.]|nr:23S rRNA (uracil(1939)-C(5))-methyltransferase RlmD [Candidatus Alistipes equi]